MPQTEMLARGLVSRPDLEAAPSKEIRVDDVRALARQLSFAALRGGARSPSSPPPTR